MRIFFVLSPTGATFWAELARTIRIWADYLRYFHPAYDAAPKLKARVTARAQRRAQDAQRQDADVR